jgi:hypothetical protein
MERLNKKGQGLSLTTIILIVLGLAVLVFLIFGFTRGWGSLWDTITQAGGGQANVDDVKRGCELACSTQSKDAYCTQVRTVKYGKEIEAWNGTGLFNVTSSPGTCKNMTFGTNYPGVGVAPCPAISC